MTDNRNRTVGEVRAVLTRGGGTLGENGSVAWMFDHVGHIVVQPGALDPDEIALMAIDAGASDVQTEDDSVEIFTEMQDLHKVQEGLLAAGLEVTSAEPAMRPKTPMTPEPDAAVKAIRLMERLEDLDDVQTVFSNLEISDEVFAQLA